MYSVKGKVAFLENILYAWNMLKNDEIRLKEALKILAQKQRVSKLTLVKWCNEGVIPYRAERHGMFEYRVFKRSDIEKLRNKLPKERVIGLSLLNK